jgi:seryl-tRNA synthetase
MTNEEKLFHLNNYIGQQQELLTVAVTQKELLENGIKSDTNMINESINAAKQILADEWEAVKAEKDTALASLEEVKAQNETLTATLETVKAQSEEAVTKLTELTARVETLIAEIPLEVIEEVPAEEENTVMPMPEDGTIILETITN